jgi:hypothetical protein
LFIQSLISRPSLKLSSQALLTESADLRTTASARRRCRVEGRSDAARWAKSRAISSARLGTCPPQAPKSAKSNAQARCVLGTRTASSYWETRSSSRLLTADPYSLSCDGCSDKTCYRTDASLCDCPRPLMLHGTSFLRWILAVAVRRPSITSGGRLVLNRSHSLAIARSTDRMRSLKAVR